MRISLLKATRIVTLILGISLLAAGCRQFSEKETDPSAGLNGSFEISKNDLPVNWLMYTPNTVADSDFEISLDKSVFTEGSQSLRFDVKSCSATGGRYSPGFTNEFVDIGKFNGEGTYKLSFWIKNDGTKYRVKAGGVSSLVGDMKILVESDTQLDEWKLYEYTIDVPKERHLRIELNVLVPGTLWIDDIQIIRI